MKKKDWSQPVELSDAMVAFPASVIGKALPPMSDIPAEFKKHGNKWSDYANDLFFKGGKVAWIEGVDTKMAARQIRACLGSFEPKHEHKEAGVGYLLSMWCELP